MTACVARLAALAHVPAPPPGAVEAVMGDRDDTHSLSVALDLDLFKGKPDDVGFPLGRVAFDLSEALPQDRWVA